MQIPQKKKFLNNSAFRGGALYFDLFSIFSLYQTAIVHFQGNHLTEFDGAIYAVDVPRLGLFFSCQQSPFRRECFFHMLSKEQSPHLTTPLVFVSNSAGIRGSIFYGGLWISVSSDISNTSQTFWICVSYNNGTFEDFIHHGYCPLGYCTKDGRNINLNNPDMGCCVGSAKKDLVLSWAAPNANSVVALT